MTEPYKIHLDELVGVRVKLFIADQGEKTGEVTEVTDNGCIIKTNAPLDACEFTFVAFRDIRSVSTLDWDYDKIQK